MANIFMSTFAWCSLCAAAKYAEIGSIVSIHLLQSLVDVSHRLILTQYVVSDERYWQHPCLKNDTLAPNAAERRATFE
jgi:hypothetical protein